MTSLDTISPPFVHSHIQFRTGVWHSEQLLCLPIPPEWDVTILRPCTPPSLTDAQIEQALEHPCGQPPLRELCRAQGVRGARAPLIIVDDPNRPTPVSRVIPLVLKHFQEAGIPEREVRILVASGTHGAPRRETLLRKLGPEASACQILVHHPHHQLTRMGKTSSGLPVIVNQHVAAADMVVGIGGVYPNRTAGFGGGSKLALGVLGYRSIMHLHCDRPPMRGADGVATALRHDLDDISRIIGLKTIINLHVDGDRNIVRVACGDHFQFYADEVAFARRVFMASPPRDVDVVIANAYPNDLSLTFVRKKGLFPLSLCSPGVSRIGIAACSEGLGFHGLFPYLNPPRFHHLLYAMRRVAMLGPREAVRRVSRRIQQRRRNPFARNHAADSRAAVGARPLWLYRTSPGDDLPAQIPGMQVTSSWEKIVQQVRAEQGGKERLKVLVYPCAPLQCIE
jgi:nickel-dependent lactate racemase